MKLIFKIIKIILVLLLALLLWINIDRTSNIQHNSSINNVHHLIVTDSIWVDVPNGLWLKLDSDIYTPTNAIIRAKVYNEFTKTWEETISASTSYTYHNEAGEPLVLQVKEYEVDSNWSDIDLYPLTNHETINNINISYGDIENEEFQINLESDTKIIKLICSKTYLDLIKPVINQAWEIIQK